MRKTMILAALLATASPAFAASYPVAGQWGVSASTEKGAIDCAKLRVIGFNGDTRTDSGGGVPAYRNVSVSPQGPNEFRVVDVFTSGQIRNGRTNFVLKQIDDDHIELHLQPGGTLKLKRCK